MIKNFLVTGDCHGVIAVKHRLEDIFLNTDYKPEETAIIILGDASVNFWLTSRERKEKKKLGKFGTYIYCVRGNHEDRSTNRQNMETCTVCNKYYCGTFDYEPGYENILYARDGYDYMFGDKLCLVVGGAYSVDKWHRIEMGKTVIWSFKTCSRFLFSP